MTLEQLYTQLGNIQFQLNELVKAKEDTVKQIRDNIIATQAVSQHCPKETISTDKVKVD